MKGLIIRDLYCLKKSIKLLLAVTAGVVLLAVLFVISTRHGNIASGVVSMRADDPEAAEQMFGMFEVGIWVTLAVPLAFIANVTDCFKEDHRADFQKFLFTMPVKYSAVVGSRYITCLLFALVSYVGSMIAAFLVSLASDTYKFSELAAIVSVVASVFVVYAALVLLLMYIMGSSRADLVQIIPFVAIGVVVYAIFVRKMLSMDDAQLDAMMANMGEMLDKAKDTMMNYGVVSLLGALLILGLSYLLSVYVMNHKKGRKL